MFGKKKSQPETITLDEYFHRALAKTDAEVATFAQGLLPGRFNTTLNIANELIACMRNVRGLDVQLVLNTVNVDRFQLAIKIHPDEKPYHLKFMHSAYTPEYAAGIEYWAKIKIPKTWHGLHLDPEQYVNMTNNDINNPGAYTHVCVQACGELLKQYKARGRQRAFDSYWTGELARMERSQEIGLPAQHREP